MKRIVFILSMSFILVSCIPRNYKVPTEHNKTLKFEDFANLKLIATNVIGDEILCDSTTGVLYLHDTADFGGGLSPLYNADGSLKNIKDYTKVEE